MINSWHCDNIYDTEEEHITGSNCTVTASSTIANTMLQNTHYILINGFYIFIISMCIIIWIFKKKI